MTTKKIDHSLCNHPATKSARAKCRRDVAATLAAIVTPEETAEERAWEAKKAAEALWDAEWPKFCQRHVGSADQNASDTGLEEGFEDYSQRWYEVAVSTLHLARDTAEQVVNAYDPEPGQALMIKGGTDYLWVEHVIWGHGVADTIVVVDREGNRSEIKPADIDHL